jgi:immune inhibitor A
LLACLVGALAGTTATATPTVGDTRVAGRDVRGHHRQPKLVTKWESLRQLAADAVATGEARVSPKGTVRLHNGQFVDYALEGTDHIVVLLAEFSDPGRGEIAKPDPSTNNWRYWIPDFSRAHYEEMLFEPGSYGPGVSMRDYYLQQSSGRYTVEGQVSRWVTIDAPESEFGANSPEGGDGSDNLNGPVYRVVEAALDATEGVDHGLNWNPSVVDVWDRYDCDGDGDFDEPDGYIDHFEIVHAGEGEEGGGGAQGGDAIWSHRWYAGQEGIGTVGPGDCDFGGYKVPGERLWVGDYTIQPEDGGVGVFAHEFGHDLGLPDLYDLGNAENGVGFWSLMASSWASNDLWTIGTNPTHMDPWSKQVLGFLGSDLQVMNVGDTGRVSLGPAEGATAGNAQVLRVNLPNYERTEQVFAPDGDDPFYYYSTKGDGLDTAMVQFLDAPLAADTTLSFRANYDIELDWDYAYVLYTMDGFNTWDFAETSVSTDTNPNGQNFGNGITGTSGDWIDVTATIPAGADGIGFEYWTDGAVVGEGFAVDSISLGGGPVDTAEDTSAWTFLDFVVVENGEITTNNFHYYLIESRNYIRTDRSLCGAYNFLTADYLEKQCYADGVLVWYRDGGYSDNDVSSHAGHGMLLPVDSHPGALVSPRQGDYWRTRWQIWDAPFGLESHAVTLHELNRAGKSFGKRYESDAQNLFRDAVAGAYWNPAIPHNSVITPGSGLKVKILDVEEDGMTYLIKVAWV